MHNDTLQATYFIGQAVTHARTQDYQRGGQAVGQAYQLLIRAGLSPEQAVARIKSLAETFSAVE